MAEIKVALRLLCDKTDEMGIWLTEKFEPGDAKLFESIEAVDTNLSTRIDGLSGELRLVADSLASAKVWALVHYLGLAAVMLGTMAGGFGWI